MPWATEPNGPSITIVDTEHDAEIAQVFSGEADAELISAAPELCACLYEMYNLYPTADDVYERARRALEKAARIDLDAAEACSG